jgi:hypothetical protein
MFSARSICRDIQNRLSAVRPSIATPACASTA